MSRAIPLFLFSTALCLVAATQPKSAEAATIPDYFFKAWTVNRDCTEAHSGGLGHTIPGLEIPGCTQQRRRRVIFARACRWHTRPLGARLEEREVVLSRGHGR